MLRPITKRGTSGAKTMAKRTTKANVETKVENKPEAILRHMFYVKHNRQVKLDDADLIGIFNNAPDNADDDWYLTVMNDSEQAKLKQIMQEQSEEETKSGRVSINVLLDKVNSDQSLQDFTAKVVEAKDLPSKAPATIAFRLTRDMDDKALASFAVPLSKEAESKDGHGVKLGDNERKGYRWDYYDHKASTGETLKSSWYLDFVDGTTAGKAINKLRVALHKDTNHTVSYPAIIDGIQLDVQTMQAQQREAFKSMMDGRRNAMATAYRKAMQINFMMKELNDKYGNEYDDNGNITKVGKIRVEFVLLNPQNPDEGLSPSKTPIRIHSLLQEPVKEKKGDKEIIVKRAGDFSGTYKDMLVSEFTNISIDGAIAMAVKAGKVVDGQPNVGYVELITAKRQKVAPTATGDGKGQAEDKKDTTKKIAAGDAVTIFSMLRDATEREGFKVAFNEMLVNKPADERKLIAYDMVETLNWLSDVVSKPMVEMHDAVKAEAEAARAKDLAEKLGKK